MRSARAEAATAALAVALPLVLAPAAQAHAGGITERADTPVPTWLFAWGAAIVLGVSFAALGALWRQPRLERPRERRVVRIPRVVDAVCGALGIAFFVCVVYAGLAGSEVPKANLAPTSVYIAMWVGMVVVSVLLGDVFRAFNPWRSLAVAIAWLARPLLRGRPWVTLDYPKRLGRWPAAAGIAAFAWLELAYSDATVPQTVAILALAYAAVQLVGMLLFGIDEWSGNADPFGVYFNLFARLSPWDRRDGVLYLRPPLAGAASLPIVPGSVALMCVAIGSTTFDGLSSGEFWATFSPDLQKRIEDLGPGPLAAREIALTIGLVVCILLVSLFYRLGIQGMQSVSRDHPARELLGRFAHSLVPIAFAYAVAHYISALLKEGQQMIYLASDPLGNGSNLFGTADVGVNFNIVSGEVVWYIQVAALVVGHVAGLILAHDRALIVYEKARHAARSQYWMLVVMVGFTSLGLWLLSAINR